MLPIFPFSKEISFTWSLFKIMWRDRVKIVGKGTFVRSYWVQKTKKEKPHAAPQKKCATVTVTVLGEFSWEACKQ